MRNHRLTLVWKTSKGVIGKNKRIFQIVDFAVPADNRIKLKEYEKNNKYLKLARELKNI